MPRVGFEPTIPAFERAKTVHALDGAATVIGSTNLLADLNLNIRVSNFLAFLEEGIRSCGSFTRFLVLLPYLTIGWGTPYRSWLMHYATSRKVAGSIPDEVIEFFN
jgi:hypothetical protein